MTVLFYKMLRKLLTMLFKNVNINVGGDIMKQKLLDLTSQCKTIKQVQDVLKKNNISYSLNEGFTCLECVVKEDDKTTHRILCKRGKIEIKTMIKHIVEETPETLLKIKLVQENCKY